MIEECHECVLLSGGFELSNAANRKNTLNSYGVWSTIPVGFILEALSHFKLFHLKSTLPLQIYLKSVTQGVLTSGEITTEYLHMNTSSVIDLTNRLQRGGVNFK